MHYQLGKSYYKKKDYQRAYESFRKSIKLCTDFKFEYTQDLVESYGYTLLKCEKYKEAMDLKKYKVYYANSPDYNFVMGLIYMNNGKFQEAVETFELCIGKNEGKIEGINSYQPNYNIGVIYEALGFQEKALDYYRKCGEYYLAKQRMREIMQLSRKKDNHRRVQISSMQYIERKSVIRQAIEQGNLEKAIILLEECLNIEEKDIELYTMKSIVEMIEGKLIDAEKTLKKALDINKSDFDMLYNFGYLYELKNQNQKALNMYKKALNVSKSKEMKNEVKERIKFIKKNNGS